ncbi:NRAMP (natural resistance-associated macrophage protein) metal ion transporters [Pustulibacterium marinum]|uniref:NRAMP (Natural resistance-associated macrophage protein) metal ion transporters n=1 Tax=Pustulibacterium marinum TaxID=1224947 RepID=A0A1I7IHX2_9FLAO|nr:Nramp family divalent metal transporter [Pustulibacterium marinum]SFU72548.1 NRAMP (natural resistance-associated macrophage protein) metal ion transporters [Pustulibacterium marinum]
MKFKKWFEQLGPGTLVAAAFIGPGTVTVCTLAGVHFGMALLWALLLSTLATIALQEMTARLGILTQKGLAEVLRDTIQQPILKIMITFLILAAIVVGNASYEAGNISGGILGLETLLGVWIYDIGGIHFNMMSMVIGVIAFILLYIGNYKFLERALVGLVLLMSSSFVLAAILTKPNLFEIVKGAFLPKVPSGSLLTIVGLIGTTVVPYNLFLHASLVKEKWTSANELSIARKDTVISIGLGGLVSMSILIAAVAIPSNDITNAADLAESLTPVYGHFAKYFLGIGLFAAGITSAITAPLAAAYVANGCLGWKASLQSKRFRAVWIFILATGVLFAAIGFKPIEIIKFAQIANGILLPLIVGILLWIMNHKTLLGKYSNSKFKNAVGIVILIISIFLGVKSIIAVFGLL